MYEFLIKKCEDVGIEYLNDEKTFIDCSTTMDGVYEDINDCNPNRKRIFSIVFDDMIADVMSKKQFSICSEIIAF